MSEWTPGPWVAVNERDVDTADGKCIAIMGVGVDEFEANAHLIAAAPDLYEALAAIMNHHASKVLFGNRQMADNAWNALAKARGEAQ